MLLMRTFQAGVTTASLLLATPSRRSVLSRCVHARVCVCVFVSVLSHNALGITD